MFYKELYGDFTVCEIFNMAKTMLNCSSSFMDPGTDEAHYHYFLWQTRKKIAEIMTCVDTPFFQITYDTLVNRTAYKHYVYTKSGIGTGGGLQPNELNEKREKDLQDAERSMKPVPMEGFENYAIVKFSIISDIDKISLNMLRNYVSSAGKVSAFLWYDFINENNPNLTFPIITW